MGLHFPADKKTQALMLKKISRCFCFDFSRFIPETAKNDILRNQNNMSSRATFSTFSWLATADSRKNLASIKARISTQPGKNY